MEYRKKRSSFETAMVIIIVVLLVLIAIASALLFLRPLVRDQGSKLAVERRLTLGKRYLSEMDYEKAVTEFSEVVRIDKKNTEAYVGLGDAYSGLGKWASAAESYDTALETVRGKAGIALADQPHNQHQDDGTSSAWQETGLTREDVLLMANLPDNEYMTDDDLYLIAVAVDPEEYGNQNESGPFKADGIELTVDEIFDIIVRRNDAIGYDLEDIRARGGDESKYRDYIDWIEQDHIDDLEDENPEDNSGTADTTVEPEDIVEESIDNDSFYSGPVSDYRGLIDFCASHDASESSNNASDKRLSMLAAHRICEGSDLYYRYLDLNNDGLDELLIGGPYGDTLCIYDIYTQNGEDPEHVLAFENNDYYYSFLGERYRATIDFENNELLIQGSYSAFSDYVAVYNFAPGMIHPQFYGQYTHDTTLDPSYFFADADGNDSAISQAEFEAVKSRCTEMFQNADLFDFSYWNQL